MKLLTLLGVVFLLSFTNNTEAEREFVVLIDPAHGGNDSGYTSADGHHEKSLTLAIANQIQTLAQGKDIKVILTRGDDQTLSLTSRLKQIDDHAPDLFLSLHLGANPFNTSFSGFRFFTSDEDFHQDQTKAFADLLSAELEGIDELPVNPSKTANFVVLKSKAAPSLLIEMGYLTNHGNCEFIQKTDSQRILSERIVSAIVQYKESSKK